MAKKDSVQNEDMQNTTKKAGKQKINPLIVLAVSLFGFFLTVPTLGYFFASKIKKGIIYQSIYWIILAIVFFIWLIGGFLTSFVGFICLLPLFIPHILVAIAILADVYYVAKGDKPKLPEF
jgi:membrane glycosyltransferase